jgi:hypothetical protein
MCPNTTHKIDNDHSDVSPIRRHRAQNHTNSPHCTTNINTTDQKTAPYSRPRTRNTPRFTTPAQQPDHPQRHHPSPQVLPQRGHLRVIHRA